MADSLTQVGQQLDERGDVLVCEILDNGLLGEGVLQSIADARNRLLKPGLSVFVYCFELNMLRAGATIIPCGARLWCVCVELRFSRVEGAYDLDQLNAMNCDDCIAVRTAHLQLTKSL